MRNTLNAYCSILLFSWLFLCLADSVTTDSMWACFTVLTIDLQTSLTHPTETLQEEIHDGTIDIQTFPFKPLSAQKVRQKL